MLLRPKLGSLSIIHRLAALSVRNLNQTATATTNHGWAFSNTGNGTLETNPALLQANVNLVKEIGIKTPLWRKEIFEVPLTNKIIQSPTQIISTIIDDPQGKIESIDLPTNANQSEGGKQAARLIVIRRNKMKRHKLKKLRKRMRFEWAKVRQKREWRKEKRFQAMLLRQISEAEKFSAEEYVMGKIKQATEDPIPRFWKGKRLPQFIIKEKLEQQTKERLEQKYKLWEKYGGQQ